MFIVLLVLFTVVMAVWGLGLLGAGIIPPNVSGWLAFFACLILGIIVFLTGTGILTMERIR